MTATILKKNQSYAVVAGLPFSITAFARGLAVAGVLLLGLIFWLSLNAQPTHQMLAERAPGKIAVISRAPAPAIIVKNEGVESPAPHRAVGRPSPRTHGWPVRGDSDGQSADRPSIRRDDAL